MDEAAELKTTLPPDQQDRLAKMLEAARERNLLDEMYKIATKLGTSHPNIDIARENYDAANKAQSTAANDLKHLARLLRAPKDNLAALREAREKVEQALNKQNELNEQSGAKEEKGEKTPKEDPKADPKLDRLRAILAEILRTFLSRLLRTPTTVSSRRR